MLIPSYPEVLREQVRRHGFKAFVGPFWAEIESIPFRPNWHADAIADHLQAVHDHQISRLVICMPPRLGKSKYVSAIFPAYVWADRPEEYIFNASYDLRLVEGFARDSNDIINSRLFRETFPKGARLPKGKFAISEYENLQGGKRFSTIIGGRSTGMGAQLQIIDDPAKASAANAEDPKILSNAITNIDGALSTRCHGDPEEFRRVMVMQRLHVKDPAGHVIKDLGWEALVLPMEYSKAAMWDCMSSLQFRDPRQEDGELLFPNLWSKTSVERLKKELAGANGGSQRFVNAQLNQDPQAEGGTMVDREWFGIIDEEDLPWIRDRRKPQLIYSCTDPGAKGEKTSHSRTAMGLYAIYNNRVYMLDRQMGHWRYPVFKAEFARLHLWHTDAERRADPKLPPDGPWCKAAKMVVEDKANGTPLLADLGYSADPNAKTDPKLIFAPKLVAVDPGDEDKVARFRPHTDVIRAGKFTLVRAPWNDSFLDEVCAFPAGDYDDQVDITTMSCQVLVDSTRKGTWASRALSLA